MSAETVLETGPDGRAEEVAPKVEPQPRRTRSDAGRPRGPKRPTATQIAKKLSGGAKAVSVAVVMASGGPQILAEAGIVSAIEKRCDEFGAAWAAVAERDPRVAEWLERMMAGGVWINACAQTGLLGLTLGILSGQLRVPFPVATFLVPELAPYLIPREPEPKRAEPPAGNVNAGANTWAE